MGNVLNKDGLDEIFDIESEHESFFDVEEITDELVDEETDSVKSLDGEEENEEEFYLRNMKDLMEDVQGVIGAAKYLCDTSPDSETIIAAANMFTSASQLLKELNKSTMQLKRFEFLKDHENMKIKARMDLAKFKAQENSKKLIMNGGTINIQNNNLNQNGPEVPYCQESIVKNYLNSKMLLKIKRLMLLMWMKIKPKYLEY